MLGSQQNWTECNYQLSSTSEVFYKKTVPKISTKIHRNTPVLECLFNKVEEKCSFSNKIPTQAFSFEF